MQRNLMINDNDETITGKEDLAIATHQLGSVEFLRSGGYVKLSDIAKPFGKKVKDWTRLKGTKKLFEAFEKDRAYNGAKPTLNRGSGSAPSGKFTTEQGLYAHPDIAVAFAQWCSPEFQLWVSRQIRHLLTYGEVNLHYTEWSQETRLQGVQYNRDDINQMYPR